MSGSTASQTGPRVEVDGPAGSPHPEPNAGEVKLWVSNQSTEDSAVALTIAIDDTVMVEDTFEVRDQHNSIGFRILGLVPGDHTLTAISGTGVELEAGFTLSADSPRWLILDYFYDAQDSTDPEFIFIDSDRSTAFD
jgi:hypothetical protein